jgi:hypothetical protein
MSAIFSADSSAGAPSTQSSPPSAPPTLLASDASFAAPATATGKRRYVRFVPKPSAQPSASPPPSLASTSASPLPSSPSATNVFHASEQDPEDGDQHLEPQKPSPNTNKSPALSHTTSARASAPQQQGPKRQRRAPAAASTTTISIEARHPASVSITQYAVSSLILNLTQVQPRKSPFIYVFASICAKPDIHAIRIWPGPDPALLQQPKPPVELQRLLACALEPGLQPLLWHSEQNAFLLASSIGGSGHGAALSSSNVAFSELANLLQSSLSPAGAASSSATRPSSSSSSSSADSDSATLEVDQLRQHRVWQASRHLRDATRTLSAQRDQAYAAQRDARAALIGIGKLTSATS